MSDDDELGVVGATVAELMATMAVVRQVELRDAAGGVQPTEIVAARGEGQALFGDGTAGTHVTTRLGFGNVVQPNLVPCDDSVEFQVELSDVSSDGVVDVDGAAVVRAEPAFEGSPTLTVELQLDLAVDVLPPRWRWGGGGRGGGREGRGID